MAGVIKTREEASIWAHLDDHVRRLGGDRKGTEIIQSHSLTLNHNLSDPRQEAKHDHSIVLKEEKSNVIRRGGGY